MEAGQGLKGLYPPIANADYAKTHFKSIPCIIKNGLKGTIAVNGKVYNEEMVAIKELGEVEIANIMNFMNYTWQMEQEYFSPENVKTVLQNCK